MDADEDAYGRALRDYHETGEGFEIVERDDGFVSPSGGPAAYFAEPDQWPDAERKAVASAEGRVLDVGCGAGRHALYLQERGHDVVGIDNSPGAVAVARERGVERVEELDVSDVDSLESTFDTVLMMGNNFGLVGTGDRAPTVLGNLLDITANDGRIIAESMDPHATDDPEHLAYHERNREHGRLPGALRIRVRYKTAATDWFEYLLVSPEEMRAVVAETPWGVGDVVEIENDRGSYVAILERG